MSFRKFHQSAIAAAVLSLAVPAGAIAQATTSGPAAPAKPAGVTKSEAAKVARSDSKFMETAAVDGMAEVQMGQLAQQKAASDQVKQFAQRMVDDHGRANAKLKQIASAKGVNLPTKPDSKHERGIDKLGKLSGAEFDREYMELMADEHRKDVADFEKQAKSAKDADLRQFVQETTPTLKEHLKMAQSLHSSMKGKTGSDMPGRSGAAGKAGG